MFKCEITIILILWKLGLVKPVQQKIKLPLPNSKSMFSVYVMMNCTIVLEFLIQETCVA